jgi:hypothetical protein
LIANNANVCHPVKYSQQIRSWQSMERRLGHVWHVPYANGTTSVAGREQGAVRRKHLGNNRAFMTEQYILFAAVKSPNQHPSIARADSNEVAGRGKRTPENVASKPLDNSLLVRHEVEDPDRSIRASRSHVSAVRRNGRSSAFAVE